MKLNYPNTIPGSLPDYIDFEHAQVDGRDVTYCRLYGGSFSHARGDVRLMAEGVAIRHASDAPNATYARKLAFSRAVLALTEDKAARATMWDWYWNFSPLRKPK